MEQLMRLSNLQQQMRYEDEHDYDSQASPRFWVVMDYRTVPGHPDYDNTKPVYAYNDGDHTEFETLAELLNFCIEYFELDLLNQPNLQDYLESDDLDGYFNYVLEHHNANGYFSIVDCKEEEFIVPNTMFLTKKSAQSHIKNNSHHYTNKAHTYAMTAWRSPEVALVIDFLQHFDFDTLMKKEEATS